LTLLKAVLGSMPIYHMSIFKVPMSILQRMKSIWCHFFNGSDLNSKKSTWVWRFFNKKDSLWAKVMQAIHEVDGRIGRDGKAGHASIWCDIIKEMDRLATQGIDLETFASSFRRLPRSGVEFEQWRDMLESLDGVLLSPVEDRWKRVLNDSGVFTWRDMLESLDGVLLSPVEDRWKRVLNDSGVFTVASARQYIDNKRLPGTSSKTRWIKEVPIKVNIHAWKVSLDGLPTRWNISRRDIFRKICNWWDVSNMEIASFDDWASLILNLRLSSKHKRLLE
nr:hypothetical protein [Tanacetum cinerariifolium]